MNQQQFQLIQNFLKIKKKKVLKMRTLQILALETQARKTMVLNKYKIKKIVLLL